MKKTEPDEMKDWSSGWYCVRAKPRMETVASSTLQTLDGVEIFLPRTQRAKKNVPQPLKPLFPGYFSHDSIRSFTFVMFTTPEVWHM